MLTISSIGVAPRPPQAPVVNAQPVSTAKPSNAVNPGSSSVPVAMAPSGDAGVQTAFVPSALPPVDPARDAQRAEFQKTVLPDAARSALAGQVATRDRYKGERPPESKGPTQVKLNKQFEDLMPNVWKASAAAVDVITGVQEQAQAEATGALAEVPAADSTVYDDPARSKPPAAPGSLLDIRA